jgi:hypothetical protein
LLLSMFMKSWEGIQNSLQASQLSWQIKISSRKTRRQYAWEDNTVLMCNKRKKKMD